MSPSDRIDLGFGWMECEKRPVSCQSRMLHFAHKQSLRQAVIRHKPAYEKFIIHTTIILICNSLPRNK